MSKDSELSKEHLMTPTQLYREIGKRARVDDASVERVWEHMIDFILEELKIYGIVRLPLFGLLKATEVPEYIMVIPNTERDKIRLETEDTYRRELVEDRLQLSFAPAKTFKAQLNKNELSRVEIKRLREEHRKKKRIEENKVRQAEIVDKRREHMKKLEALRLERLAKKQLILNMEKTQKEMWSRLTKEQKEKYIEDTLVLEQEVELEQEYDDFGELIIYADEAEDDYET